MRVRLPSILTLFLIVSANAAEPRHPGIRILSNARLQLEVMDPAAAQPYYRGARFSPVANVLRAVLDGHDFLYSPVAHDPLQEDAGLAMEFDLFQRDFGPPGFVEAADGEGFVKVGVGVLKKAGEKYNCAISYEIIKRAETDTTWSRDSAQFYQVCDGVNGYAYVLDVTVSLSAEEVEVQYQLRNTGAKELLTEQYAHNFFQFDGRVAGPDYEVEFPYDFEATIPKPVIEKRGKSLVLNDEITPKIKAAQAHIDPLGDARSSDSVIVRNRNAGMEIVAQLSRPVSRFTLHVAPPYLAPEQFLLIKLEPGETTQWTRTYKFILR